MKQKLGGRVSISIKAQHPEPSPLTRAIHAWLALLHGQPKSLGKNIAYIQPLISSTIKQSKPLYIPHPSQKNLLSLFIALVARDVLLEVSFYRRLLLSIWLKSSDRLTSFVSIMASSLARRLHDYKNRFLLRDLLRSGNIVQIGFEESGIVVGISEQEQPAKGFAGYFVSFLFI
ncbi:uncharacterized protein LOC111315077 [Durio zibethinus]|uniref:Uncharacterized protein LOC111315077 n=1 Tax=Durio zibethinus TaxID=66656 RepID=A0A6P6B5H1_DURZI|nr:uncharacterized protein LOC111315077 [Durio zibethinus]